MLSSVISLGIARIADIIISHSNRLKTPSNSIPAYSPLYQTVMNSTHYKRNQIVTVNHPQHQTRKGEYPEGLSPFSILSFTLIYLLDFAKITFWFSIIG